jgi:hypothetical protein
MRASLLVLVACQARPAPSPPVVVPLVPDAAMPDAAEPDAAAPSAPVPSVTLHARQIVKSSRGVRKTFTLTRTGIHVDLVIETATWADHKRIHLDGSEHDESMWIDPVREEYAGAVHDIGPNKVQLELSIVSRSHQRPPTQHRDRLSFTCTDVALVVRAKDAIPIRINPKSTVKTGCNGSPVRWNPPAVEELTLFACGPQSIYPKLRELPFTPDGSVDWVAELVDCHIQEVAYRRARPR